MKASVSCILPTSRLRQHFVLHAIHNFLVQDYSDAELIIIDDGPVAIDLGFADDNRIHYHYFPEKFSTLGAKRNYACAQANGDIILHWDDDDWYAPDWISKQVEVLLSGGADICGLKQLYFFKPETMQAWLYDYGRNNRAWVAGATLAYKKAFWKQHPFTDRQVGEDNYFVWQPGAVVQAHDYTDGFVSMLHRGNTSPKYTEFAEWNPRPIADIQRVLGKDYGYYDCHQDPQ